MRSSRRGDVDPFIVMDVMEAARAREAAGHRVIHMEVGQPGTPAPRLAREALGHALESDALGYTVALGLPELRARIARLYGEWYGLDLDPGRVVVTSGSSGGCILAFTALFDAGERVALGAPGYPSYRQILRSLDLVPVEVQTAPANRYQPVPSDLRELDFEGLMVASPANPTGTMLDRQALSDLIDVTAEKGAAFLSDEIYHGIEYDRKAVSALEISDDVEPVYEIDQRRADEAVADTAIARLREDLAAGRNHLMMARCDDIPRATAVFEFYRQKAADLKPLLIHSEMTDADERVRQLRAGESRIAGHELIAGLLECRFWWSGH